ncbi:MAG: succinate CoA transferase [Bacteroidales bacterium]|nr:succinate CoA transferase [Candidatus Colicola caccequi]MCQ2328466.1 succinate CoA transferase [Paludibacteraceae bacterium]
MLPFMTADEAAALVQNGAICGMGGFTPAGAPKDVPSAIARKAEALHAEGKEFKIGMYTGASTGDSCDGALARAHAILFRTPYQGNKDLRTELNAQGAHYFDLHLSELAQELRYGFMPKPDFAIIEACDVVEKGGQIEIVPTAGVGNMLTFCELADKIIIEWNAAMPKTMRGLHDLYEPLDPPQRREIPVYKPSDRIGTDCITVDAKKVVAVVHTDRPNEVGKFTPLDETTQKIGNNVAKFLEDEMKAGRIPASFLPIQSGVGNVANAVLGALGENKHIPAFEMYTEVIQDSVVGLMKEGRVKFASGCSLTIGADKLQDIIDHMDFFKDKIVLRPQEISNNPELARRMGLITINTALEADIYGNINSTHVCGTKMMNGIGGSGDFTRNAYISIYTTPSTAKNGCISAFVPMVSHLDHSEHSVKIIITEHGIADLRGKNPVERAHEIINNCVDPEYRPLLNEYLEMSKVAQTPHTLSCALAMHEEFIKSGDMRNTKWENYKR